jgi:hypothetical protein
LYRCDFDAHQEQYKAQWDALIKRRDLMEGGAKETIQAEIERVYEEMYAHPYYFRDSYNDSSLFWKLNLSWWGDLDDYTDGDAVLHPDEIKKLEKEVRARSELLAKNVEDLPQTADDRLSQRYFFDKFDQFLDFLKQAHEGGHTIRCSC